MRHTAATCLLAVVSFLALPSPRAESQSKTEPKWADISKSPCRIGDVSVSLAGAGKDGGSDGSPPTGVRNNQQTVFWGYLHIRLKITNHSENRKFDYRPWSRAIHRDARPVVVGDELGNNYKPLLKQGIWFDTLPPDDDQSLYPGKDPRTGFDGYYDTLIYEMPIPAAKVIRLSLPAAAVGQTGTYHVEFPTSAIKAK